MNERYSYVFDGNSQAIDHTLVAGGLLSRPHEYDPVHVNAEFFDQVSDHDPQVTGVTFAAPAVSAGGPYTVDEGGSVALAASGSDAGGGSLTYRWDLDGDGTFETAGSTPTFSAASIDGPATRTVSVQATAPDGATAVASTTVTIANVAPTATFTAPASVLAPNGFALSLSAPSDPSAADTAAGFTYAFDCGAGYGAWSSSPTAACDTTDVGPLAVRGADPRQGRRHDRVHGDRCRDGDRGQPLRDRAGLGEERGRGELALREAAARADRGVRPRGRRADRKGVHRRPGGAPEAPGGPALTARGLGAAVRGRPRAESERLSGTYPQRGYTSRPLWLPTIIMEREPGVWVEGPDGELIPDYDSTFPEINEGQVVHGTVVRVDKDEVLVDIGYKSEGVIPVSELSIRRSVNPADEVSLGDEIDALVLTKEDAEGRLILSKKRARFELAWKNIEQAAESGEPVNGRVIEVVKGGLILDLGVRGFLPASLVDIRRVQDLDEFLGQELRAKVIELNRSRNNVVLSRRAVLEEERKEQRQTILDKLQPGDVVEGQISNIVDFGAFVDLDGMDGLIHISELSWSHVNHPSEVLEIGQTVEVKVLDIDRDRQRISLGLKQTQSDPWQQVIENYSRGRRRRRSRHEGRHVRCVRRDPPGRRGPRAHLRARAASRREPARGRLAGPARQREDHRGRRRAPPALALAEARRGHRSGAAARRRWRVGAHAAAPDDRSLGGGLRGSAGRRSTARPRSRPAEAVDEAAGGRATAPAARRRRRPRRDRGGRRYRAGRRDASAATLRTPPTSRKPLPPQTSRKPPPTEE